jgi:fatty-acyl-CoA synthase
MPMHSEMLERRIEESLATGGRVTFLAAGHDPDGLSWAELHDQARGMAAELQARGLAPGDHIALIGPTSRALVTAIQAVWLIGGTTVILPLPMRLGSLEQFIAQTRVRIANAEVKAIIVDPDFAGFLDIRPGDPAVVLLTDLTAGPGRAPASGFEDAPADPSRLAILQFTSGSTCDPKGVMLPHATVGANLDAIAQASHLDPESDVLVSWLPLYHDMGLIGLLMLGMTTGTDLVLSGPQDFLSQPGRWAEWMSAFGGTATAGPNFSYALLARAMRRMGGDLDLSPWRIGLNGAEPIDPGAVDAFVAAGAPHGLRPGAVFCAFGMAESTLAVTFPEPMTGLRTDAVEFGALETTGYAMPAAEPAQGSRLLAMLGRPVPGLEIRVVDRGTGIVVDDRCVGELEVRGTSITPGYYRQPEATAEAFHDGWLRSGDLAYLVDGELVVCGRSKDMIIIGGRNVFPEDVERAASEVDGVRAGNVIAFGVDGRKGRESIVVVAESKSEQRHGVRQAVIDRVRAAVGLSSEVVLVNPGTLPKTSSGKLQRSLCRTRYLDAELDPE